MRGWIKRLERDAREDLASFELVDGSRYFFDTTTPQMFMHFMDCIHAGSAHNWPEPPEVLRKVCEAKDVGAALREVGVGFGPDIYDRDVLIHERRLVPTSFVSRYDPQTGERVPVGPYEEPKDLSE